jgi:hypothetical protein
VLCKAMQLCVERAKERVSSWLAAASRSFHERGQIRRASHRSSPNG